jgi:HAD domain in Swiss Army Knife RNA repair proteins
MHAGKPPLILLDVDGVLNPEFSAKTRRRLQYHEGWLSRKVWADGSQYRVFLNPLHGSWLRELASATGAELAWATTWEHWANVSIAPLLGLTPLPFAPAPRGAKAASVVRWTQGRAFCCLRGHPPREIANALAALAVTRQPAKMICPREKQGLSEEHIADARQWLTTTCG